MDFTMWGRRKKTKRSEYLCPVGHVKTIGHKCLECGAKLHLENWKTSSDVVLDRLSAWNRRIDP